MLCSSIGLVLTIFVVAQAKAEDDRKDYFTAAVFETFYYNQASNSKHEIATANLAMFQKVTSLAASKGADIINFPEYGIWARPLNNTNRDFLKSFCEFIPDPNKIEVNPCDDSGSYKNREILKTLSCMAQKNNIYVSANMGDCQPRVKTDENQDNCPDEDYYLFNTGVVFDRKGNLISRYHKNYLFFEPMDAPTPMDKSVFKTKEFGVVSTFSCSDAIWKAAVELVEENKVETLIFHTKWHDDIVPLDAVEFQQAFALTNKVNFLASNGHFPSTGTLGSGIYSKTYGAIAYTYTPNGKSKLLIANVPRGDSPPDPQSVIRYEITADDIHLQEKEEDGHEFPDFCLRPEAPKFSTEHRCFKAPVSTFGLIKLQDKNGSLSVCENGLCCNVTYSADRMDENYYLAVFNGTYVYQDTMQYVNEDCMLVRCDPVNEKPCRSLPPRTETIFDHVELRASFSKNTYKYPAVSLENWRLAPKSDFTIEQDGHETVLKYVSSSDKPLLKVAIMGRDYDRDPPFFSDHTPGVYESIYT